MKKAAAFSLALLMALTVSCGKKDNTSPSPDNAEPTAPTVSDSAPVSDKVESPTEHISPRETVTTTLGIEHKVDITIPYTTDYNTVEIPLSNFIEEGDVVSSFTFIIYSADGNNIGTFKGGCGISLLRGCAAANNKEWYQSPNFTAPTQGTYGEITWNVPDGMADYIDPSGNVLFGYWWGDAGSIRIDSAVCTFTRTTEIPCDGEVEIPVKKSVSRDGDNTVHIPLSGHLKKGAVPELVTFNISSPGELRKFSGSFGYSSERGDFESDGVTVFTHSSETSLTWLVPDTVKNLATKDGELMFNYWWSEQPSVDIDSISVKYSLSGEMYGADLGPAEAAQLTDFRSSQDIVRDIKVGWNLGNSLESYGTERTGLDTETAWGNPRITKELILSVKDAGFNAIRIPVTWGEHMTDGNIQYNWLNRVQEVVDYAYNNDMYVIINMHHDDYIWFDPTDAEYSGDSKQLKNIWKQVAIRFRDYGDRLIFEGVNEPRTIGSANEWIGGTPDERKVVNRYLQDFVDTVRSTGGNNEARSLIVTTYGANAEEVSINDLTLPEDDHLIVSIHYYAPWMFSSGQSVFFGDDEKAELTAKFDFLESKFTSKKIPVIIGEFGCIAAAPDETRADYYNSYIAYAKERGIKCFVWDNGVMEGEESYGILDRKKNSWNQTILDSIIEGSR